MRRALVLSAGAMFGAYQVGAWKTLAHVFEPEMIVGSSAGALNGWMIAGGATADDLMRQWNDPSTAAMMRLRVPWLPWRGIFAVRALESLVRQLAERWRPRIPFYAIAAEVPGLRLRVMRGEEMTWRHLLAACAVPLGFPPVRINGRLFVDGGLLCVLPTGVAAELGASHIVAVNVLPAMPSRVIRGAVRAVRYFAPDACAAAPADVQIRTIAPDPPLGTLADSVRWEPENVHRWMERGAADAARDMKVEPARGISPSRDS